MSDERFDFDGGDLSLDFANTNEWHASQHPLEHLGGFDDLVDWGEAAGLIDAARASELHDLASQRPAEAAQSYAQAISLREAIYRIFSAQYRRDRVSPEDLQILNNTLSSSLSHLQVAHNPQGFSWKWRQDPDAFGQVLWPIARSAADLLTSGRLDRVRECEDDRGCGFLFIDTSRNRSRRWCSMESCGNRAKAKRHYARASKSGAGVESRIQH